MISFFYRLFCCPKNKIGGMKVLKKKVTKLNSTRKKKQIQNRSIDMKKIWNSCVKTQIIEKG